MCETDPIIDLAAAERVAGLAAAVDDLRRENERLRRQVAERGVVERAKVVVAVSTSVGEEQAFRLLHTRARDERRPVGEVAGEILERAAAAAIGPADRTVAP